MHSNLFLIRKLAIIPNKETLDKVIIHLLIMRRAVNISHQSGFRYLPDSERVVSALQKYAEAVKLFASSDLTIREVAQRCNVTPQGLSAHISKHHRPILFARYGLDPQNPAGLALKVKPRRGQSLKTHLKYKEAIEACGDIAYIEFNISQIARIFDLDGPALAAQLRVHYPDIIPNREIMRQKLGIADNIHRGARLASEEEYRQAVEMYRDTDLTIPEVAEKCNVSLSGLSQFMRFYHHQLITEKALRRAAAQCAPARRQPGALSGNGRTYGPSAETVALYAEALEMYRNSDKTIEEICKEADVPFEGFRSYIYRWHRGGNLRRGFDGQTGSAGARRILRSAQAKYGEAIASLRANPRPTSKVAAEYGFNADVFREYLKTHAPDLASAQGMVKLSGGHLVKRSSYEKYRPAIEEYAASPESLRSIAQRHGIVYNSLMTFVARNCPAEKESHDKAVREAAMQAAEC